MIVFILRSVMYPFHSPHGQKLIAWRESLKNQRKDLEQSALDERIKMHELKAKIHGKEVDFSNVLEDKPNAEEKK